MGRARQAGPQVVQPSPAAPPKSDFMNTLHALARGGVPAIMNSLASQVGTLAQGMTGNPFVADKLKELSDAATADWQRRMSYRDDPRAMRSGAEGVAAAAAPFLIPGAPEESALQKFDEVAPEAFERAVGNFSKARPSEAGFLTPRTAEQMRTEGMRTFLSPDGKTGYALADLGDGRIDIRNVFNHGAKGQGARALAHALSQGGNVLDHFDTNLGNLYRDFGFHEYDPPGQLGSRLKFDDQYAPEGWDYDKHGRPDVVFQKHPEPGREPAYYLGNSIMRRAIRLGREEPVAASAAHDIVQDPVHQAPEPASVRGFPDEPRLLGTKPADIMNKSEETPVAYSLAHHTVNASNKDEWLQSVSTQFPGLAAQLRENPTLADRLYRRANVHADFVRSMPSSEQALLDFHDPKSQALMNWYREGGTYRGLQSVGVPEPVADKYEQFRAILSPETPPENETYGALQAWQAHERGTPLNDPSFQNDIRWVTGKGHPDKVKKLTNAQQGGMPWATQPGGAVKTSPYYLTGRGINSLPVVDVHMARYYTGRPLAELTDAQKHVVSGRMLHDAQLAGVSPDQFQAGIWAKQTGYDFGFGLEGASPMDWTRFHLASGEFDDLIQRYPGLQRLANEGHAGIAGLSPERAASLAKRWPQHQGLQLRQLPF